MTIKNPITTLITCHTNADWDALASMTGLWTLYPNAALLFPGSMTSAITRYYQENISTSYPCLNQKELHKHPISTLVIADTAQFARVPVVHELISRGDILLHIWDHHPKYEASDRPPCHTSLPETLLQSLKNEHETLPHDKILTTPHSHIELLGATATLVCEAIKQQGVKLSPELATLLGLGLYADTGNFTFASTTTRDLHAAAWLLEQNMDLQQINTLLAEEVQTPEHVHTLSELIENAKVHKFGLHTITITSVSSNMYIPNFSRIVQELMAIQPCDVLFALATMEEKVVVVARSVTDDVDVGVICKALGGGGHPNAASANIKNKVVAEIIDIIFQQVYAQIHPHKLAKDLMSSPPISLDADLSITEAEYVMNRYGLKAAPVTRKKSHHCIGFIEWQTASRAIKHGLGSISVSEYMQRRILTASPDTSLQKLIDIIVGLRQRLVPIVQDYALIGVVTRTDLINMFVNSSGALPAIKQKNVREQQITKTLHMRLSKATHAMLVIAGTLADELHANLYLVGGLVRDILLNITLTGKEDLDMVVEGEGLKFAQALAAKLNGRVREHKMFMTSIIIYHDENGQEKRIDIATARLEYYEYPAALPSVELSSIKMDLFRRDFTINAMAIRLNITQFGHLVDFFGGQNDIQRKTLRVIHALSFVEDPTRILRAVRFEQRFGLHIISQTEKLIKNALELQLLDKLSGARILNELTLIFQEKNPKACCDRLQHLGLLQAIHPALTLNKERSQLLERLVDILDWYTMLYQVEIPNQQVLYFIALMSGIEDDIALDILHRLGIHDALKESILETRSQIYTIHAKIKTWQHTNGSTSELWKALRPLSLDGVLMLMARAQQEDINRALSHYITKWRRMAVDINGNDLHDLGVEAGPNYGVILRATLLAKLDQHITTREEQLQYAKELLQKFKQEPNEGKT